jgi:hypothetical protein
VAAGRAAKVIVLDIVRLALDDVPIQLFTGHSQLKHRIKQSLRRARDSLELCERVIEATAYLDGRPLLQAVYTPPDLMILEHITS